MAKQDDAVDNHVSGQSNEPMSRPAHALTFDQVVEELQTDAMHGLTSAEAKSRHEKFGNNDLGDADGVQPLKIILAQVANAMTLVSLSLRQKMHRPPQSLVKHITMAEPYFLPARTPPHKLLDWAAQSSHD